MAETSGNTGIAGFSPYCCHTSCCCCSAAKRTRKKAAVSDLTYKTQTNKAKVMLGEGLAVTRREVAALALLQPDGESSAERRGQVQKFPQIGAGLV